MIGEKKTCGHPESCTCEPLADLENRARARLLRTRGGTAGLKRRVRQLADEDEAVQQTLRPDELTTEDVERWRTAKSAGSDKTG